MAIENKEQAFREGRAVKSMAETIMRKTGAQGEPTGDAYDMALTVIEANREASLANAELLIDIHNIWADIEDVIGEENARQLADVQEEVSEGRGKEVIEFLKGEREIEDVLDILEKAVGKNEVGGRILGEYPDIKPQLAEYQMGFLKLAKATV